MIITLTNSIRNSLEQHVLSLSLSFAILNGHTNTLSQFTTYSVSIDEHAMVVMITITVVI